MEITENLLPINSPYLRLEKSEVPIMYPQAEYDRARLILMHEPEEELSLGTFHPKAALFKGYFDPDQAKTEHRNYQELLKTLDIKVFTLRQILLAGCVDEYGHWIEGEETDKLRKLVASFITFLPIGEWDLDKLATYKAELVKQYTPNDVMRILLEQPDVKVMKTTFNTGVRAAYRMKPMMNLFYLRDQVITTPLGVIVGNMNSPQRGRECDLVEFCLCKLGINPLHRIQNKGAFLEGGDYIPMRDYAWINCGLRTTQEAIDELLENNLLGKQRLVVVKDTWKNQAQMHLDTYFNVIDKDLVTLCSNRYEAKPGELHFLTVDIYDQQSQGGYICTRREVPILDFLKEQHIEVIEILPEDEEHMANNFLCIEGREIVMVSGQSENLKLQLEKKGVTVHWANLNNLIRGYGAAHCMTQVIGRSRVY